MKKRLTITIFLIAALAVALSSAVGFWAFRQREVNAARVSLNELLNLMDAQSYDTDPQGLAAQFSAAAPGKRLTIVARDGAVLADTAARELDDHSDRPEITRALEEGRGESTRYSQTTGVTTLYAAKVFTDGSIGRVSMPLSSIEALVWQGVAGLFIAAAAALLLALLLSRRLAATTVKPVEEAEEAIEQVDETLKLSRMEFTANVTHELKTPLTSIKGFTEMLSSGMVNQAEDQKRFYTMISVEVDRLMALIDDVLKISELESVAMAQTGECADALAEARDVAELLRPAAGSVAISVTGTSAPARISPPRLREVILNLAENAVKYNRPGGAVTVDVGMSAGQVQITVTDTGIGIPAEAQSHVFERFYRVDKGRDKKVGGTGLGLAIVKHTVELYGGGISLESAPGVGTTVTVTLPGAPPHP